MHKIASSTPRFVDADLAAVADKARHLAMERTIDERNKRELSQGLTGEHAEDWEQVHEFGIRMSDFEEAVKTVQGDLSI